MTSEMISLREHLEMQIAHERELREHDAKAIEHERDLRVEADKHERELRIVAEGAVERAREIQFQEYERRLTGLNHAHEQALEAQKATVPRETFDNYVRETRLANELALKNVELALEKRGVEVDRRLIGLEDSDRIGAGRRSGIASTLDAGRAVLLLAFAAAGAIISYLASRPPT